MNQNTSRDLNHYIQRIVSDRSSDVTLWDQPNLLHNTVWTMMYTTMDILPRDTTIQLQFHNAATTTTSITTDQSAMQYRLLFGSKTFGLTALNVNCHWTAVTPTLNYGQTTIQPSSIVSLTYDSITMDAFGFQNIHLCLISNLFQGRTSTIDTVYYDGTIWIERQVQSQLSDWNQNNQENSSSPFTTSDVIWNVYRKERYSDP
jgi:hypothetical protein